MRRIHITVHLLRNLGDFCILHSAIHTNRHEARQPCCYHAISPCRLPTACKFQCTVERCLDRLEFGSVSCQFQQYPLAKVRSFHESILFRTMAQLCFTPNTHSLATQQDTARAVIDAYNAWDVDAIMAYRSPGCKHRVLPFSMDQAAKSNDEYRAYLNTIMPLYSNFTVSASGPSTV